MYYITTGLFYLIPIASIVFFITSLYLFIAAKRKKMDLEIVKRRKLVLIIASTIFGTLLIVVLMIVLLLFSAVAFM